MTGMIPCTLWGSVSIVPLPCTPDLTLHAHSRQLRSPSSPTFSYCVTNCKFHPASRRVSVHELKSGTCSVFELRVLGSAGRCAGGGAPTPAMGPSAAKAIRPSRLLATAMAASAAAALAGAPVHCRGLGGLVECGRAAKCCKKGCLHVAVCGWREAHAMASMRSIVS